jgi:hypothetical protein
MEGLHGYRDVYLTRAEGKAFYDTDRLATAVQ